MSSTSTITFTLDGDVKTFQILVKDAESLKKVLGTSATEAKKLSQRLLDMNQAAEAFRGMETLIRGIESAFGSWSAEFNEANANETRLAQSMKNAMGATREQTDAIVELTDAQEELGIIDGQFQISAAQQLSKFLQTTDSLQTLIPLMNDMAAQQYGVAASEQNLISIATQLGKVLTGQTEALRRSGYSFSDAQKDILKYGTEAEKVSLLVEVIGAKVGGMNEELGKTDAGRMAQLEFRMGRVREAAGSITTKMMPLVTIFAQVATGVNNIFQLTASVKAFGTALKSTGIAKFISNVKLAVTSMIMLKKGSDSAARSLVSLTGSAKAARTAIAAARAAAGLAAAGLGLLVGVIAKAVVRSREQKRSTEEAAEAYREQYASVETARVGIEAAMSAIRNFSGTQEEQKALIDQLNSKWGDAFGHYDTLSEWYDTLSAKVDVYCDKLAREIELRELEDRIGRDELLAEQQQAALDNIPKTVKRTYGNTYTGVMTWTADNPEYTKAKSALDETTKRIEDGKKRLEEIFTELSEYSAELSNKADSTVETEATGAASEVEGLERDIEALKESIRHAVEVNQVFGSGLSDQEVEIEALKSGITGLIQKYGIEEQAVRQLIDKYNELSAAQARTKYGDTLPELSPITGRAETAGHSGLVGNFGTQAEVPGAGSYEDAAAGVNILAGAMQNLTGIVGEGAAAWLQWMSNILSAVGAALPQLSLLIAKHKESANAATASMAAKAGESVAATPFVGAALAVAAIAAVVGALGAIPKFASGGLAYGPTLGLFGEYPGAARNPEVVAPLDRLRSLLRDPEDSFGHVEFEIRGDRLYGVLNRYNLKVGRS